LGSPKDRFRAFGRRAGARYDARVKTLGWPYPAHPRTWRELHARFTELGASHEAIVAIIDSIQTSDLASSLAAFTSMDDLMVLEVPLRDLPYDLLAVRVHDGKTVEIEHLSVTGRNDQITRAAGDAVPLFWRFVEEKFGLQSRR
jgi:hypothetical protein